MNKNNYPSLIYFDDSDTENPEVKCPVCAYRGKLMDSFSLLKAGFNGIKPGDPDDLDVQECGYCQAKLSWHDETPKATTLTRGWWKLTTTITPNDTDIEHIADLITQGYTEGEIVQEDAGTPKPAKHFEEDSPLWSRIFDAIKITGDYEEALHYMFEGLTFDQYNEIEHFFDWLEANDLPIGHGNYFTRYMDYKREENDRDDDNSHRRQEGYCNNCAGDCQYDYQGNLKI